MTLYECMNEIAYFNVLGKTRKLV